MTFMDDDNSTAAMSLASTTNTCTTLDDVELQGSVLHDHDQLPSVEEYKAQQQQTTTTKVLGTMEIDQADGTGTVHDQLPNIEDYKVDHDIKPISGGNKSLRCLGIASVVMVVLVTVIVVPLAIVQNDSNGGGLFGIGSSSSSNSNNSNNPPKFVSRIPAVQDYLRTLDVSLMSDMQREGSPQHSALQWIADDDAYQMPLPDQTTSLANPFGGGGVRSLRQLQGPPVAARNAFVERYSLAVFYYSTRGPKWDWQLKFLTSVDHCDWYQDFWTTSGTILRMGVNNCKLVDGVNYVSTIGARK
jgi:hypothetical protein